MKRADSSRRRQSADSAKRQVRGPTFFFKSVITWSTIARQDSHNSMSSTSTGARGSSPMMGESALHRPLSQTQRMRMHRCSSSGRLPAARAAVKHSGRNERTKGAHNAKHRKHGAHHAHHPGFPSLSPRSATTARRELASVPARAVRMQDSIQQAAFQRVQPRACAHAFAFVRPLVLHWRS